MAARNLILQNVKAPEGLLTINGREDHGVTGNFEITINGKLIHSKSRGGHGFLHNNAAQQQVVVDEIKKQLEM